MGKRAAARPSDFLDAIVDESDRGCVLVSAAWLEDQIRDFIEAVIEGMLLYGPYPLDEGRYDATIREVSTGILGNAFDRVIFCRATGAIDDDTERALKTVFTMRNHHFAHFAGVRQLSDALVADHLANLRKALESWAFLETNISRDERIKAKGYSQQRYEFMDEVTKLSMILLKTKTNLQKFVAESAAKAASGIDLRKQDTPPDELPQVE